MKVVYIANDGKQFEDKQDCEAYENKVVAREILGKIKAICKENNCFKCPFRGNDVNCVFDSTELPENFLNEVRWD